MTRDLRYLMMGIQLELHMTQGHGDTAENGRKRPVDTNMDESIMAAVLLIWIQICTLNLNPDPEFWPNLEYTYVLNLIPFVPILSYNYICGSGSVLGIRFRIHKAPE